MEDPKQAVIDELVEHIGKLQKQISEAKRTINSLRQHMGQAPMYSDDDLSVEGNGAIRPDQFYGKPLAKAVREFLELRKQAATSQEILAGLEQGGYDLNSQGWKKDDRVRSLSISLSKNSITFHRLPSGTFGLRSWYTNIAKKTRSEDESDASDNAPETE